MVDVEDPLLGEFFFYLSFIVIKRKTLSISRHIRCICKRTNANKFYRILTFLHMLFNFVHISVCAIVYTKKKRKNEKKIKKRHIYIYICFYVQSGV